MKLFKRLGYFWLVCLPLLLPGLLSAMWRCVFRIASEQKNIYVETVVDFDEMRQIANEEGRSIRSLFGALKSAGASSVAIPEDTLASLESDGKITLMSSNDIRKLSIDEGLELDVPLSSPGALYIHSSESTLLDRIEQNLGRRIALNKIIRAHRHLLVVNKSGEGFKEFVGVGFSNEYLQMAGEAGLGVAIKLRNYPGLTVKNAEKIINSIPPPASVSALLFANDEALGARGNLNGIVNLFRNRSYRIGWVEFNPQDGMGQYLSCLSDKRPFVRLHTIKRPEMNELYDEKRAVARFVRAVKDRSIRMLYIRCFFQDEKKYIADLAEFNLNFIKNIAASLNRCGFKIAQTPAERLFEARHMVGKMSFAELFAISLSLALGVLILLRTASFKLSAKCCFAVFALTAIFYLLLPQKTFIGLVGLIGAVSYSSAGVIWGLNGLKGSKSFFKTLALFIVRCLFLSVMGGILIAGVYSNVEFLLGYGQFRGVKIAFILPPLIAALWLLKTHSKRSFAFLNKPLTPIGAGLLACAAIAFCVYLLRSGNSILLKPSAAEDSLRTFLENALVARPRTKEFLLGYPASVALVFFYLRKEFALLPILAILAQIGQVSVVNSFCHLHTSLSITLLRVFNGLWLGLSVGFIVLFAIYLLRLFVLWQSEKSRQILLIGYFGFDNYGDELLKDNFIAALKKSSRQYEAVVLSKSLSKGPTDFITLKRSNLFLLLEKLVSCRAVIIPGGGVLQSSTSLKSLFYYTALLKTAQLAGAKILLPAQGFGPFQTQDYLANRLNKLLLSVLNKADYITCRDENSLNCLNELNKLYFETAFSFKVSADFAFLNNKIKPVKIAQKVDVIKLCVVLRSSAKHADEIASVFVEMTKDFENFVLCPAALQPVEDELVWRKVGWQGDIIQAKDFERAASESAIVVSMRLHGCVASAMLNVPWLALSYDPKVKAFADACSWRHVLMPQLADQKFIETCINEIMANRTGLCNKLKSFAAKQKKLAASDFKTLLNYL